MAEIEDIAVIKKHLTQEELKHVYLFYGPETYLKDLYTQRIKNRLSLEPMNCYSFGAGADPAEIENICSSVSMFGEQKLIVISGSGMLKAAADPGFVEKAAEGNAYLIFKEDEIDKRNKLYKKVCELGIVFYCKRQAPREIKKMLQHTVKAAKREIREETLQYLLDGVGEDISRLMAEIEKLILYVPEGGTIEKAHVDALCNLFRSAKLFDLNDAVASGEKEKAYRIMKSLLYEKEPPVKLLAILSKMWSQLYSAKLLSTSGANTAAVAAQLGVRDFAAGKLVRQAGRMELQEIRDRIDLCEALDSAVKSGALKDAVALELLVIQ